MAIRSICVFLSSSPGARPEYAALARATGIALASRGLELVYGGASVGLMGVLADATVGAGGRVVGILPESLVHREIGHRDLAELHVVPTMHARKAEMFRRADAFLVLPGGFGTLEEAFEILTAAQIGEHAKPLAFVDVAGFWRPLIGFLDHAVDEGMLRAHNRALASFHDDLDAAFAALGA